MNKKNLILTAVGVTSSLVLLGSIYTGKIYADSTDSSVNDVFISKLAERLGVGEDKVQGAIDESRDEIRQIREEERKKDIDEAVGNGDLTQRQADILEAMHEVMSENFEVGQHQRGRLMQENMVEKLNEKGLEVSEEELETLRETMRDLELGGQGQGKGKGMGMGMGMHRGF